LKRKKECRKIKGYARQGEEKKGKTGANNRFYEKEKETKERNYSRRSA